MKKLYEFGKGLKTAVVYECDVLGCSYCLEMFHTDSPNQKDVNFLRSEKSVLDVMNNFFNN